LINSGSLLKGCTVTESNSINIPTQLSSEDGDSRLLILKNIQSVLMKKNAPAGIDVMSVLNALLVIDVMPTQKGLGQATRYPQQLKKD